MSRHLGVVEARLGTKGRGHPLARRLGGHPLLAWIVRRVSESPRLDEVVVMPSLADEADLLAELVPPGVSVVHGPGDLLCRYARLVERSGVDAVVRVNAAQGLADPVDVDRLVQVAETHPDCDYITYQTTEGRPAVLAAVGLLAEWCSARALRAADREAQTPELRNQVTGFLLSHPDRFALRLVALPTGVAARDGHRAAAGDEAWERVQALFEAQGPDAWNWQEITRLAAGNAA